MSREPQFGSGLIINGIHGSQKALAGTDWDRKHSALRRAKLKLTWKTEPRSGFFGGRTGKVSTVGCVGGTEPFHQNRFVWLIGYAGVLGLMAF